jgi:hypothetical protein
MMAGTTMKRIGLLVSALAAAALPAVAAAAETKSTFVIGGGAAGPVRLGRSTLPEATSGFAAGERVHVARHGSSCTASWKGLGLSVTYAVIGTDPRNPCVGGVAVDATVTNRPLWSTAKGLRIGDGTARLRHLYPRAPLKPYASGRAGYWLVTARACEVVGAFPYPRLFARVSGGHVASLTARIAVCD